MNTEERMIKTQWIPVEVTNAIIKTFEQEGKPDNFWPIILFADDGETPIKINSIGNLVAQTISQKQFQN